MALSPFRPDTLAKAKAVALLHIERLAVGKAVSIRRDLDFKTKVAENVSGLQDRDRTLLVHAKVFCCQQLSCAIL